jgi:class 3 adenylate cyclase
MLRFSLRFLVSASASTPPRIADAFAQAERNGLKIAIKSRLVALVLLGLFLAGSRSPRPETAMAYLAALTAFGAFGLLHHQIIGSRLDRPWVKYVFVAVDFAVLSLLIATQPLFENVELPQAIVFRNPVFPFYFVVLAVTALSFSPGLVLWAGVAGVTGWLGGFAWAVRDMPVSYDWTDVGTDPSTEAFSAIFFDPNFIGTGSRIQESIAFLVVALLIAAAMWRARAFVRRQLELEAERREISEIFGRYLPKAIADALIADRGLLQPVEKTATVMFADIAGFTALSEASGPRRIVDILNDFFDQADRIISARHGVVTHFQGDAILATFNLPVEDAQHATHALLAAQEIIDAVHGRQFSGAALAVRIGIYTGPVVAGSVGGVGRQNYTVYGDTVNLAARLETLNKEHGTELLVGGSTVTLLGDAPFREMGAIPVRGFSTPVPVYTPTPDTWPYLRPADLQDGE